MWLNADSIVPISGNRVDIWNDLSTQANHFQQNNSINQPYLLTSLIDINNHNMVEFNSSSPNYFNSIDFSSLTEGEIFSTIKLKNAPPSSQASSGLWSFGTASSQDHYPYTDNVIYSGFGRNLRFGVGNISSTVDLEKPHLLNINSGSSFNFRINEIELFNSTGGTSEFSTNAYLGRSAANHFMDGSISEIILFNSVLSDSLRDLTHAYLRHKYAPPVNLRSEEHTSELQSRPHLVCRLLLEKKNHIPARMFRGTSASLSSARLQIHEATTGRIAHEDDQPGADFSSSFVLRPFVPSSLRHFVS